MKALSIAWKDTQVFLRDRGGLVLTFLLPALLVFAWNIPQLAVGSGEEANLIILPVVDADQSDASQEFVEGLHAQGRVQVESYDSNEAGSQLEVGNIMWVLEIPAGFSELSLEHPVSIRLIIHPDADRTEAEAIETVVRGVANSLALKNQLMASFEHMGAMSRVSSGGSDPFDTGIAVAQAERQFEAAKNSPLVTINVVDPQVGATPVEFTGTNIVVPGFAALFAFLTAQTTALSIFQEKKHGSFRRLLAAPLGRGALLCGKILPNVVITLAQIVLVFTVGRFIFPLVGLDRLTFGNDPLALILLSLVLALCSSSLGLLIAALSHTEAQAGAISTVLLWVMGALGGSFFPTFLMEGPLKSISSAIPHSWALRGYNAILVYGEDLSGIAFEMGILLAFTVGFFAIGLWRFDFD